MSESLSKSSIPFLKDRRWVIIAIVAAVAIVGIVAALMIFRGRSVEPHNETAAAAKTADEKNSPSEVQLTAAALQAAGVEMEAVTQRPAVARLKVTGTVETNAQQTQSVTPLVSGRVDRVNVSQGDRVNVGAVLATISSPEVAEMHGKLLEAETQLKLAERNLARVQRAENRAAVLQAKAKLDEAEATLKRTKKLIELGVGAGKDLISAQTTYDGAKAEYEFQSNISLNREVAQAQAEVETARVDVEHQRRSLTALGDPAAQGGQTDPNHNISLVVVRSPVAGTVTERLVNSGAGVQAGTALFTIANISNVWVIANVPETQVASLRVGTPAEIRSAAFGNETHTGRVNYIDPRLNEETRTARVRVELPNPGERLKAGMFVEVGFQASTNSATGEELVVPSAAVQRIDERSVVFIPKEGETGVFLVRDVELGGEVEGYHRVLSGLKLGERVITKGSFTLKTQLLKSALEEE